MTTDVWVIVEFQDRCIRPLCHLSVRANVSMKMPAGASPEINQVEMVRFQTGQTDAKASHHRAGE